MPRLQRILLYLAVIMMPFQDTILGKSPLGYIGSSPSSIPLAIHGILGISIWLSHRRLTISRRLFLCLLYVFCVSMIYLVVWGPVTHGGSVIYKSFSGAIVLALWGYAVFYVDYAPSKGLRRATYIAFSLLIVGVIVTDLNISGLDVIGRSQIVHATLGSGGRGRGFSSEPSIFSATVVSLGIAAAYLSKSNKSKNIFVFLTLLLLLLSQSKGGLLVIGISGFVMLFLKRPGFLKLVAYLTVCTIMTVCMIYFVVKQVTAIDLVQATGTFATRISMAAWSFIVAVHHPFGVGLSGFYEAITIYLPSAMDWLNNVSPVPLNFSEVQEYVHGNMATLPLDTKCFLLEYIAMFGIPFLVLYVKFSRDILRGLLRRKQDLLMLGFIFLLIGMSTYVNGPTLYAGFYLTGMAYREYLLSKQGDSVR
jgi:O-Antigen ligase